MVRYLLIGSRRCVLLTVVMVVAGGAEEGALVMGLVVWERVKQIDFILLHWRYVIVQGRGG